jgi:uncharacterized protein YecE (DUF72 family)
MHTVHIGTAGWSISSAAASRFPLDGSHLQRYAQVLDCVEINSSFYRPHQPSTYARWAASVPEHFRFSVKLPRSITHERRLRDCAAELDRFAGEVMQLGNKLGCVLVQLPPSLRFEADVASAFFHALRQRVDGMLACEARHPSWFEAGATDARHHARAGRSACGTAGAAHTDDQRGLPAPARQPKDLLLGLPSRLSGGAGRRLARIGAGGQLVHLRQHGGRRSPVQCAGLACAAGLKIRVDFLRLSVIVNYNTDQLHHGASMPTAFFTRRTAPPLWERIP